MQLFASLLAMITHFLPDNIYICNISILQIFLVYFFLKIKLWFFSHTHLILISCNICSLLLTDESKLMKGVGKGGGGGSVRLWSSWMLWQVYHCNILANNLELQSEFKVSGHFVLYQTHGLSVHLPLPTPNTMLMLIQPKYSHYSNIALEGEGDLQNLILCQCQLPICPKDFWPGWKFMWSGLRIF